MYLTAVLYTVGQLREATTEMLREVLEGPNVSSSSTGDRQIRFEAHVHRAHSLVHVGQWRQAAGEWAQASELQPEVAYLWTHQAIALLAAGDVDAYRQTCASLVQRFVKTVRE